MDRRPRDLDRPWTGGPKGAWRLAATVAWEIDHWADHFLLAIGDFGIADSFSPSYVTGLDWRGMEQSGSSSGS